MSAVSSRGNICASYYMHPDNSSVFDFGWPDACAGDEVAKEISFDMLDEFGTILGTEDLPFKVIKKGKFTLIDAI